jgi:hypothetical protein
MKRYTIYIYNKRWKKLAKCTVKAKDTGEAQGRARKIYRAKTKSKEFLKTTTYALYNLYN